MPKRPDPDQAALPGLGARRGVARVRRGVDAQLAAQRELRQLEPIDDGLVALARTLGDAIDAEVLDPAGSRFTVGALAGRLMPVLLELRGHDIGAAHEGLDDELAALVVAIRDAARSDPPDAG